MATVKIAKASKVTLSKKTYTYNGKVKKPSVIVKDSNGTKLKKGTDYSITYAKGRKKVGKYTVKITLKGENTVEARRLPYHKAKEYKTNIKKGQKKQL